MTGLLIGMFGGVLMITRLAGIVPVASQTMLSQLAHLSFGDGPAYLFIQAATAAVLLMAANTSYNDFPRVLFLMARDRQAPRSFLRIGDRLTFRNGILLLSSPQPPSTSHSAATPNPCYRCTRSGSSSRSPCRRPA